MYPNASIRSVLVMHFTPQHWRDLKYGKKSAWSDTIRVARRKLDGDWEELKWRVEVRADSKSDIKFRIRLHWLKGESSPLHWTYCFEEELLGGPEKEVCWIKAGSVVEHPDSLNFAQYYNSLDRMAKLKGPLKVELDIMADANQSMDLDEINRSSLGSGLHLMLKSEDSMADVKFVCEDKEFPCHKLILSYRSAVFKTMLTGDSFKESQDGKIEIRDFEPDAVEQFLTFLYCGKCDFSKADPWELMKMGHKYDIESLIHHSSKALEKTLTGNNCKDYLENAILYKVKDLIESAVDVALRNPDVTNNDWTRWAKDYPELIGIVAKAKSQK